MFVKSHFFPWFVPGTQETGYVPMVELMEGRYQINFQ